MSGFISSGILCALISLNMYTIHSFNVHMKHFQYYVWGLLYSKGFQKLLFEVKLPDVNLRTYVDKVWFQIFSLMICFYGILCVKGGLGDMQKGSNYIIIRVNFALREFTFW